MSGDESPTMSAAAKSFRCIAASRGAGCLNLRQRVVWGKRITLVIVAAPNVGPISNGLMGERPFIRYPALAHEVPLWRTHRTRDKMAGRAVVPRAAVQRLDADHTSPLRRLSAVGTRCA